MSEPKSPDQDGADSHRNDAQDPRTGADTAGSDADGAGGADAPPDTMPDEDRCIWPGCTRPRAPGRTSGSGRQKEYCLQADPPEQGGGPTHNARNRWAALRNGAARRAARGDEAPGDHGTGPDDDGTAIPGPGQATGTARDGGASGRRGPAAAGQSREHDQAEHAPGKDPSPFASRKKRAADLLDQARRQHAAALTGLRAELELYQRAGQELASLADPAAADLEIATIAARAGRQVAQAEQEAADARRAQLAAQRERDDAVRLRQAADAATEQLTEDTAEAERLLAERTADFERDLADLAGRAQAAEAARRAALEEAAAVKDAAEAAASAARDRAEQAAASLAEALRDAARARERARQETAEARSRADDLVAAARQEAAAAIAEAREQAAREQALLAERASAAQAEAGLARTAAAQARESADRARDDAGTARAAAAAADARAEAAAAELERSRAERARLREAHDAELARLEAAHDAVLAAERARAVRAETELKALHTANPPATHPEGQR